MDTKKFRSASRETDMIIRQQKKEAAERERREQVESLKLYINDAHGEGYDTVELPIETARAIQDELERLQNALNEIWNHTKGAPFDLYENKDRLLEVRAIVGNFTK